MYKKPDPKPITVEAVLLWKHPDRLVAMDAQGFLYTWFTKTAKQLGSSLEEGCIVYVHADGITRETFHITPKNDQAPDSAVSEGDA